MSKPNVHFTVRERKVLTHHLVARVAPKTRKQRRWFDSVFVALKLDDYEHQLRLTGVILPESGDETTTATFCLDDETVDYLLESFNVEVNGAHARLILQVENRLLGLKDGSYVLVAPQVSEMSKTSSD